MARKVTCTNNQGTTITFGENAFEPFLLAYIDGVYETENNVIITANTMSDGGTYQGSTKKVRNIVLGISDKASNVYRINSRDVLYNLFPKNELGTLTYWEDGIERVINYRVESVKQGAWDKRLYTVSLLCDDPYFYAKNDIHISMASAISNFEFEHEFYSWEEISYISQNRIATVDNMNAVDDIGLTITITTKGNASNITVTRIESDEHITVGHSGKPLNMILGDKLIITTGNGDKHVYFERDGEREEINEYITEDSVFIQLARGINNIGYSAESGEENLTVELSYKLKYEGA